MVLHARTELIAGAVAAAVIAGIVWFSTTMPIVLGWLAAIELIYGLRYFATARRARGDADEVDITAKQIRLGLVAIGLMWGVATAGLMFLQGVAWPTSMLLVTVVVLSILVLGSYLGHRSLVLPFVIAASAPVAACGLLIFQRDTIIVSVASIVFMAALAASAKYVDQLLKTLYDASSDRDRFYSMLKMSEKEIARLKLGVKTNSDKRLKLENELQDKTSELSVVQGKAQALSSALEQVSPYDNESGLLNAKKFQNVIEREWSRMLRQELPLTIVHMSLDNFDGYEQTYGKVAREAGIRRIGELIKATGHRPGDVAARTDAYKFAILLPEADHKNGEILADNLRQEVRELSMPNANSPMHSAVTASFGVATVIPNSDLTIAELISRADSALYEATFQGGDKVVRYRTMNTARLERWNSEAEGEFSPDGLLRKLAVWGYDPQPKTLKPGEYQPDRRVQVDTVDAIIQGSLKVTLEGDSRVLNAGDCLFLPKGVVTSAEVVGGNPVICLEGMRH